MPKAKVSLDDLLALKRQEKPDQQFWEQFDKNLSVKRKRQLIKQAPGKAFFMAPLWSHLKLASAMTTTVAACGVVAYLAFQSESNDTHTAPAPQVALLSTPSVESAPSLQTYSDVAVSVEQTPVSLAVKATEEPTVENVSAPQGTSSDVRASYVEYTYQPQGEFARLDLDSLEAALDAEQSTQAALLGKYADPLKDLGANAHYASYSAPRSNDRVNAYALNTYQFQENGSLDIRLDTVSLKF